MGQLAAGAAPPRQARKVIQRDHKIEELKQRFSSNSITLEEYLSGVSAHTII